MRHLGKGKYSQLRGNRLVAAHVMGFASGPFSHCS